MKELFDKLYKEDVSSFQDLLKQRLESGEKTMLVTANPEIFSRSEADEGLHRALLDENVIISPDGEGIVKAARMLHYDIWGKIAGVDSVEYLLKTCDETQKSVYFYGSKQQVLDNLKTRLTNVYPNLIIAGMKNGYENEEAAVFQDIHEKKPDLVFVALGVPRQELVIYKHFNEFDHGMFIGVGGSLDVLSGTKRRAPKIFIVCKLEWLYRILREPKRIKKFYETHVKFIMKIKRLAK